jgi:hypothetical protein
MEFCPTVGVFLNVNHVIIPTGISELVDVYVLIVLIYKWL